MDVAAPHDYGEISRMFEDARSTGYEALGAVLDALGVPVIVSVTAEDLAEHLPANFPAEAAEFYRACGVRPYDFLTLHPPQAIRSQSIPGSSHPPAFLIGSSSNSNEFSLALDGRVVQIDTRTQEPYLGIPFRDFVKVIFTYEFVGKYGWPDDDLEASIEEGLRREFGPVFR